jgi:surfeit locus 1 family protein
MRVCHCSRYFSNAATINPSKRKRNYLGASVFGTLVIGTFGLGAWQTNRYFWKEELIKKRENLLQAEPVDLLIQLKDLMNREGRTKYLKNPIDNLNLHYTRVKVTGFFDHSKEIMIGPRVPPKQDHGGGMNIAEVGGESSGYFIVTPLILDDGAGKILIQRGWVPDPVKTKFKTEPALRFTDGKVTVEGVIVPPEVERTFSPPNNIVKRQFLWFDPVAACQATGIVLESGSSDDRNTPILPLIVNATNRCNPGQFPVVKDFTDYSKFHVGLETHATYAATWYSLSFFGAIMNYIRFLR